MTTAFETYELGGTALKNRLVMAPMTRSRATAPDGTATESLQSVVLDQAACSGALVASITRSVTSSMAPIPSTWVRMPRSAYLATMASVCSLPCGRGLSRFRKKATRIGLDGGNHLGAAVGQLSATCFTFAEKRKPGQYLL